MQIGAATESRAAFARIAVRRCDVFLFKPTFRSVSKATTSCGRWCPLSAPLFANKLLSRTAEIAICSRRYRRRRCCRWCCRRRGRNAGVLARHCECVAIDLTRERCRVQGRRCDGYWIHRLISLSEKFGSERCTIHERERCYHNTRHRSSPIPSWRIIARSLPAVQSVRSPYAPG